MLDFFEDNTITSYGRNEYHSVKIKDHEIVGEILLSRVLFNLWKCEKKNYEGLNLKEDNFYHIYDTYFLKF